MRFRLNMAVNKQQLSETVLPINYKCELSSWIYRTINASDSGFARWLHQSGYTNENRKFKLFTFSNLIPGAYHVEGDRLVIGSENTELTVSFYLPATVENWLLWWFQ